MPRKPKKEVLRYRHFTWRLFQRKGVWQADGRSNPLDAGRHSLGTEDHEKALELLHELDSIKAVDLGLIDEPDSVVSQAEKVSLELGRERYEDYIHRPAITGGVRKSSAQRYSAVLDKFFDFCRKKRINSWNEVNVTLLSQYVAHLEDQGYAWRTIYLEANTIKQIFKWLIRSGHLPTCKPIELPLEKAHGTSTYCWTPEEVAAMLEHCQKNLDLFWLQGVIIGLACTGLRIGELASLRWNDLDLEDGTIRLTDETTRAKKNKGPRRTTKTHQGRSFPIHPDFLKILKELPQKGPQVFYGPRGGRLKPDTVRRLLISEVLEPLSERFQDGVDEISFIDGRLHSFRHYFCSTCANSGIPQQMVMRWLGHRSSQMVRHYYHLHDSEAKRRMSQLNFLGTAGGNSAGHNTEPETSED